MYQRAVSFCILTVVFAATLFLGAPDAQAWPPKQMPPVNGWDESTAKTVLNGMSLGLKIDVVTVYDPPKAVGTILEHTPKAGTTLNTGDTVTLYVSTGFTANVPVPDVANLPKAAALLKLSPLFVVKVDEVPGPSTKAGQVIGQSPPASSSHAFRGRVTIQIVRPKLTVPSLVGKTEVQAKAALTAAGLNANVKKVEEAVLLPGLVVSQDPDAGDEILPGATVRLSVSERPGAMVPSTDVPVPDLRNLPMVSAINTLVALGLVPSPSYQQVTSGPDFHVLSQVQVAGTTVAKGSAVSFTVSQLTGGTTTLPVTIPPLTGMQEAGAKSILTALGLTVSVTRQVSVHAAGKVFKLVPPAGSKIAHGSAVILFVSSGGGSGTTRLAVPDLVGVPSVTARAQLFGMGLVPNMQSGRAPNAPVDVVMLQQPRPGTQLAPGAQVTLFLPLATTAPAVIGLGRLTAETRIQASDLVAAGTRVGSGFGPTVVLSQHPLAGTRIAKGSTLSFDHGTPGGSGIVPPGKVRVGNYIGKRSSAALAAAATDGLNPTAGGLVGVPRVISRQSLAPGSIVSRGTAIDLTWGSGGGGFGRVSVPDFRGMTETAARFRAGGDFRLRFRGHVIGDPRIPTVDRQSHSPGSRVTPGTRITLHVVYSGGGSTLIMPNLRGWRESRVDTWAAANGLSLQKVPGGGAPGPAVVTNFTPRAGSSLTPGSIVQVTITGGGGASGIAMPNMRGWSRARAHTWGASNGITIQDASDINPPIPGQPIVVLRTRPASGTFLIRPTAVTIVLGTIAGGGGGGVRVPDMTGWTEARVNTWGSSNGVRIRHTSVTPPAPPAPRVVISTTPGAGAVLTGPNKELTTDIGNGSGRPPIGGTFPITNYVGKTYLEMVLIKATSPLGISLVREPGPRRSPQRVTRQSPSFPSLIRRSTPVTVWYR